MQQEFISTNEYVASEQLMASVNVAIALQKPLLIKGEPGTGKTMLAQAVAKSLGKKLIIWNIKSTTKAQDGLYMYDTIQRLYDGQFGEEGVDDTEFPSVLLLVILLLPRVMQIQQLWSSRTGCLHVPTIHR